MKIKLNNSNPQYYIHKKCDFCHKSEIKILYKFDDKNLVKCLSCNLVYFDKPRIDFHNLYNENYYFQGSNNSENYTNYYTRNQKELIRENYKFAYDFIKNNTDKNKKYSLLDIGAGFGYFLKYLPKNITSYASEVSEIAVKELKKQGYKVYNGNFPNIKINKKFNFITSFDVIEHQIHLSKYLKKINSLLNKNGFFIFTTPDWSTIFNKILGRGAPTIQPLYHNYYFDKKWVTDNFPKTKFDVIRLKTNYVTKMTIEHLILMSSFPFPIIKKLNLIYLSQKLKLGSKLVIFLRMGGIEGIVKKQDK